MMPILKRLWRHSAKAALVLLFSIPLLASLQPSIPGTAENRQLAPVPSTPHTWSEALAWPASADRWINDHLGWRSELIALNNQLRYTLFDQFPTRQLTQGKHGRLFLSAYNPTDAAYSGIQSVCGDGTDDALTKLLITEFETFSATMQAQRLDARLLVAPSAPMIYQEDLPHWLQARCAATASPIQRALATPALQSAQHAARILYPLEQLRAARAGDAIFPATWFHWAGDGPRLAAELSMARFWPAPPSRELASTTQNLPSDLNNLAPGLEFSNPVKLVDFSASGIQECRSPDCYPEMPDLIAKLWGVNRYHNPAAPLPRLVLISDSFGLQAGPWFARYYRDVLQVATNDLARLTPAEVARLKTLLFQQQTPQHVLFLYHDGTVQGGGRIGADLKLLFPSQQLAGT